MARQSSKKMYFALKIIHSFLPVAFQLPGDPAWTTVFFPAGSLLLAKWPSPGHTLHPLQILTAPGPSLIGKMAVSNVLSADAVSTPVFTPVIWQYLTRLMIWSGGIYFPLLSIWRQTTVLLVAFSVESMQQRTLLFIFELESLLEAYKQQDLEEATILGHQQRQSTSLRKKKKKTSRCLKALQPLNFHGLRGLLPRSPRAHTSWQLERWESDGRSSPSPIFNPTLNTKLPK